MSLPAMNYSSLLEDGEFHTSTDYGTVIQDNFTNQFAFDFVDSFLSEESGSSSPISISPSSPVELDPQISKWVCHVFAKHILTVDIVTWPPPILESARDQILKRICHLFDFKKRSTMPLLRYRKMGKRGGYASNFRLFFF